MLQGLKVSLTHESAHLGKSNMLHFPTFQCFAVNHWELSFLSFPGKNLGFRAQPMSCHSCGGCWIGNLSVPKSIVSLWRSDPNLVARGHSSASRWHAHILLDLGHHTSNSKFLWADAPHRTKTRRSLAHSQ